MNFWHDPPRPRIQCCIRVRWPPSQIRNLVLLYRENPCLWNRDDPQYLDYCSRRAAYRNIHEKIKECVPNCSLVEVVVKLREVRKFYVIELKRFAEAKRDGCVYESRYTWFGDIDEFLRPHLHVDERADAKVASSCSGSSDYRDETTTPSPRSPTGLSEVCLSSDTPPNISRTRLNVRVPSASTQLIKSANNSGLTERKSCDQLDLFAKAVVCRLRRMSAEVSAQAQSEIQQLLADFEAAAACDMSKVTSDDTCDHDCECETIMPYSRERGFMCQESNYTV